MQNTKNKISKGDPALTHTSPFQPNLLQLQPSFKPNLIMPIIESTIDRLACDGGTVRLHESFFDRHAFRAEIGRPLIMVESILTVIDNRNKVRR